MDLQTKPCIFTYHFMKRVDGREEDRSEFRPESSLLWGLSHHVYSLSNPSICLTRGRKKNENELLGTWYAN
jgi:hypothetical protein